MREGARIHLGSTCLAAALTLAATAAAHADAVADFYRGKTLTVLFEEEPEHSGRHPAHLGPDRAPDREPPETPGERVAALRTAFAAAFNDPAYRADAARERLEVDPVTGAEVETIVRRAFAAPPDILSRLVEATKPPR